MSNIKERLKDFDELCLHDQLLEASHPMWLNYCRNLLAELEKAKKVINAASDYATKSGSLMELNEVLSKHKEPNDD